MQDDPYESQDRRLGWPLCVCGHPFSLHSDDGGCKRGECLGLDPTRTRCAFYRPAGTIDRRSPAEFAQMVSGVLIACLPLDRADYNRHSTASMVASVVAQLATQWTGWEPGAK